MSKTTILPREKLEWINVEDQPHPEIDYEVEEKGFGDTESVLVYTPEMENFYICRWIDWGGRDDLTHQWPSGFHTNEEVQLISGVTKWAYIREKKEIK